MDDLIKELTEKAGLTEEQAKAAIQVFLTYMKHEENRNKIAAATASLVAARVV